MIVQIRTGLLYLIYDNILIVPMLIQQSAASLFVRICDPEVVCGGMNRHVTVHLNLYFQLDCVYRMYYVSKHWHIALCTHPTGRT